MGLIRKQMRMDLAGKVDAWRQSFCERHCWSNGAISRGNDNKLYPCRHGIALLLDIIDDYEIPDYILISYKQYLSNKKIELWYTPITMTPEEITQNLNRISDHIEGLEAIIKYDMDDNIVWSICRGGDKKWTLRRKK
jgi:hypothetical protein